MMKRGNSLAIKSSGKGYLISLQVHQRELAAVLVAIHRARDGQHVDTPLDIPKSKKRGCRGSGKNRELGKEIMVPLAKGVSSDSRATNQVSVVENAVVCSKIPLKTSKQWVRKFCDTNVESTKVAAETCAEIAAVLSAQIDVINCSIEDENSIIDNNTTAFELIKERMLSAKQSITTQSEQNLKRYQEVTEMDDMPIEWIQKYCNMMIVEQEQEVAKFNEFNKIMKAQQDDLIITIKETTLRKDGLLAKLVDVNDKLKINNLQEKEVCIIKHDTVVKCNKPQIVEKPSTSKPKQATRKAVKVIRTPYEKALYRGATNTTCCDECDSNCECHDINDQESGTQTFYSGHSKQGGGDRMIADGY